MRSFASMHEDYLDPDRHLWFDGSIELTHELEACGRVGHGLCGKDADLDYGGQILVWDCFWLEDNTVEARVKVYASLVPDEQGEDETSEEYEAYMDDCFETVCGEYPGEWDGDYWVLSLTVPGEYTSVKTTVEWDDDLSDEENKKAAVDAIYQAIFRDPAIDKFQRIVTLMASDMERPE